MSWQCVILLFLFVALGLGAVISVLDFREGEKNGIKDRTGRTESDKTV